MYPNQPIFSTIYQVNGSVLFSEWEAVSYEATIEMLEAQMGAHGVNNALKALFRGETVQLEEMKLRASGGSIPNIEKVYKPFKLDVAENADVNDLLF